MKRFAGLFPVLLCALTIYSGPANYSAAAEDWIFAPGPYSNSPKTGQRVDQYQPLPKVDRIPFDKFFAEDGPHPFGMDYWWGSNYWSGGGYGWGGGYGMSPYAWGGYPYALPLGMP